MTGIIYGNTIQAAEQKLDTMIEEWVRQHIKIKCLLRSPSGSKIMLSNNECWYTKLTNEFCRGFRCNVALIDKNIPQEIIEQVIMPCVTNRPWTAVGYY